MRKHWLTAYAIAYVAFLYLPILLLPLFSFNAAVSPSFPIKALTLKWYEGLPRESGMMDALLNSLIVGATAACGATLLGLAAARAITRYRFPGKPAMQGLIMAPLFLPEILVGIALLAIFLAIGLDLSLFTIAAAHVLFCLPYAVTVLMSSFEGFDISLEEASADLGETALGTFRRVVLPLVMPGMLSSLIVTFTVSLDEFMLAFFLSGQKTTLPVYIWSQLRFPFKLPSVMALGSLMLLASVGLILLSEYFRRLGGKHKPEPLA